MSVAKARVAEGGRIIIPAAFRKALGVAKGDAIVMELHSDELRVRPARTVLRRLQERLKAYAPAPGALSVSEELVAERRQEAERV